ncbi:MAG: porphobilinogen synthase [Candidatus Omnitrophica bacterium]|nr:porphobilinogen synthase [Candidatus Omnitrophota bacterium]
MKRFRRLRNPAIRNFVQEHYLTVHDLWQPFFVLEGKKKQEPITSMPGIKRFSVDLLLKEIESYMRLGGRAGVLFGVSTHKDLLAKSAYDPQGPVPQAIKAIKKSFPEFLVVTDVCLCAYTSHGHCGIVEKGTVHNDKTLAILAKIALCHAEAGANLVAPSDMMDFRVKHIRQALDTRGFEDTGILSYAVKYVSAFYGPFREAAHSATQFGDRKTYQMNPANSREALKEARQDVEEGADMIMVKPALAYLDIVGQLRRELTVPIVAYNVSGEYAMVKAASQKGWLNEQDVVLESLLCMKRAGADIIISYHTKDALKWIKNNEN